VSIESLERKEGHGNVPSAFPQRHYGVHADNRTYFFCTDFDGKPLTDSNRRPRFMKKGVDRAYWATELTCLQDL
jgi:hypothetical protein